MSQPATLTWFARHELSLAWRDWLAMMTAGKRSRERKVAIVLIVLAAFLHLIAYGMVAGFADAGAEPGKTTLIAVTGTILIAFFMMLSQAMESVTRAFYARADLDLILSSPASARRVFALRIGAIALATTMMALLLAGSVINVLALKGGAQWLGNGAQFDRLVVGEGADLLLQLSAVPSLMVGQRQPRPGQQCGRLRG